MRRSRVWLKVANSKGHGVVQRSHSLGRIIRPPKWSLYGAQNSDKNCQKIEEKVLLEELFTQKQYLCSKPNRHIPSPGELWLVRLFPPIDPRFDYYTETPTLNGFVISSLIRMEAVEAIESIRHAFHRDIVELFIAGNLEEVEVLMGLRQPKPRPNTSSVTHQGTCATYS